MTGAATAKPALRSLTSQSDVLQQGAASEAGRLSRPEFLSEAASLSLRIDVD